MNVSETIKFIENWAKTAKSVDTFDEYGTKSETLIDFEKIYGDGGFEVTDKRLSDDYDEYPYAVYKFIRNTVNGETRFWYLTTEVDFELNEIEDELNSTECETLLNTTVEYIKRSK